MSVSNPTRDDFSALLEKSFSDGHSGEGQVVKGIITAIEKDMAIIDVGLKVEGRVPLKEFGVKGKDFALKVGDTVEVYVERIENALGEAMLRATRLAAKRAGSGSKRNSPRANASKASSSTRSRAASPSISTAPWRSCRAARSTSARSATSRR